MNAIKKFFQDLRMYRTIGNMNDGNRRSRRAAAKLSKKY